jgi:hypothetical protein
MLGNLLNINKARLIAGFLYYILSTMQYRGLQKK